MRRRQVAEYRRAGAWLTVLGAPGQSYDDLAKSTRQRFGDVAETGAELRAGRRAVRTA